MKKRKEIAFLQSKNVGESHGLVLDALPKKGSSSLKAEIEEIHGYPFSREEDAILKDAIVRYIKEKHWEEEEGVQKLLNCRKYIEAYGCWDKIKESLPHRPRNAVRKRARRLLDKGSFLGRWSKKEADLLRSLQEKHGNEWRNFSSLIGRSQFSIREKWRGLKITKATGVWTREEMQQLSDLVHECLRRNLLEGKIDKHTLRDNICWDWIANNIGTHSHSACCIKWYKSLSSGMVTDRYWSGNDDYVLLESLLESGACTEEEVEWDSLLDHRSGQTCLLRWKQLAKHLGENQTRGFLEKLDALVRRYAPELLSPDANHQM